MITPKVSVIMSTYSRNHAGHDCENLLKRAVDSVLNQTFQEIELVLIDDGSKDGSEQVCREYELRDDRVRYFRFSQNSGTPAKRYNDGILLSRCDLLCFMFDDDIWFENAVADLYEAITVKHPTSHMVYSLIEYFNLSTNSYISKRFGDPWDKNKIEHNNFLCNNSVIVRKSAINAVGGYDETPLFKRLCDWDLWLRIGRKFEVTRIEKVVGRCFAANKDAIGVIVPLSDADVNNMKMIQRSGDRNVRLKSELDSKKTVLLVHDGHDAALRRWNLDYLSEALKNENFEVNCFSEEELIGNLDKLNVDTCVFYRNFRSRSLELMKEAKKRDVFICYGLDDYVFQDNCKYYIEDKKFLMSLIDTSDCVIVTTPQLQKKIPAGKKTIIRRNNVNDETLRVLGQNEYSENGVLKIGWFSGIDRHEMDRFVKNILVKLDKKEKKFRFFCLGKHSFGIFKNIMVTELDYVKPGDWKRLYELYVWESPGVVINPLVENDEFFSCKSEVKLVETSALGVPLIVSRVSPFTELITEGKDGFFASSEDEFVDKIMFVSEHQSDMRQMSTLLKQRAMIEFNVKYSCRRFVAELLDKGRGKKLKRQLSVKSPITVVKQLDIFDKFSMYNSRLIGDLRKNSFVEQQFRCPGAIITEMRVFGATYCRRVTVNAHVEIYVEGTKVHSGEIPANEMTDNGWWPIYSGRLHVKHNSIIKIRITNKDSFSITLYCCSDAVIANTTLNSLQRTCPFALSIIRG